MDKRISMSLLIMSYLSIKKTPSVFAFNLTSGILSDH